MLDMAKINTLEFHHSTIQMLGHRSLVGTFAIGEAYFAEFV